MGELGKERFSEVAMLVAISAYGLVEVSPEIMILSSAPLMPATHISEVC
jgi:hypothetical protein